MEVPERLAEAGILTVRDRRTQVSLLSSLTVVFEAFLGLFGEEKGGVHTRD